MFNTSEMVIIGAVILLLFGGKKLPELMKGVGQGIRAFKQGMNEPVADNTVRKSGVVDNEVRLPAEDDITR